MTYANKKVLVIGSGPVVIGQGAEFDYAGTQACIALKEAGYEIILVNNNPATIMTDEDYAHTIYFEPLTSDSLSAIIQKEKPNWLLPSVSGQTGLNLAASLEREGVLDAYDVQILGTSIAAMEKAENREQFRSTLKEIDAPILDSTIVSSVDEAVSFMGIINEPVIVRPAYTLGGTGGGIAYSEDELGSIVAHGLQESPIHQCLLEKSIAGWKEIEFEVLRDIEGESIIVCHMENMDPVGVHTGDSVVVIPVQTWTTEERQMLEHAAIKMVDALGIVGACNVQFALHPTSGEYYFIEVNPRVSRSSALASKAIGFPIAHVATELSIGKTLQKLVHPVSKQPYSAHSFTQSYVAVKFPRWVFDTFTNANRSRGTEMKATGEVIAFEMNVERAFHKAVRSLDEETIGVRHKTCIHMSVENLWDIIRVQEDRTFFALIELLYNGISVEELHKETYIDVYFLNILQSIVAKEKEIKENNFNYITSEELLQMKQSGYSDVQLASIWNVDIYDVLRKRMKLNVFPMNKEIKASALDAYMFSSWKEERRKVRKKNNRRILIIGSGPIRIGQGIEFDYCSVQATRAFQKLGYEVVLLNNNPATVSTDFNVADRLYIEPITVEDIVNVATYEQVDEISIQFGGQTALNVAEGIEQLGFHLIGTSIENIEQMENRDAFYQFMQEVSVRHIPGATAHTTCELGKIASSIGYPILLRPSYVIGGKGMIVLESDKELQMYQDSNKLEYPILVDAYIEGIEIEIDVISDGIDIYIPTIFEHIEKSGVHSGDSYAVAPPVTLSDEVQMKIVSYVQKIAKGIGKPSIFNMQFVLHDGMVYVLEINPRASRTVPIVSKHCHIPFIEYAIRVMDGERLKNIIPHIGLGKNDSFYTMKAPVYSTEKLAGVDPKLNPEMQSTGEVMALGSDVQDLVFQSFFYNEQRLQKLKKSSFTVWIEGTGKKQDQLKKVFSRAGWNIESGTNQSFYDWLETKKGTVFVSWEDDHALRIQAQKQGLIVLSTYETACLLASAIPHSFVWSSRDWIENNKKEVVYK